MAIYGGHGLTFNGLFQDLEHKSIRALQAFYNQCIRIAYSFFASKQPASLSPNGSFSRASLADLKSRSKWIPSLAQKNSYSNGSDEYSYVESPVDAAIGQGASVEDSMAPWVNAVMVKAA